jgi:phospholipase/carboxylesterase
VTTLKSARAGVAPGQARRAVVFLHGYGADGADLLGLAQPMAPHLPGCAFYAPDAPEPCRVNPMGRQWFPIPRMDGSTEAQAAVSMASSAVLLNAFLDQVLADEGLAPETLALLGFSQGTMMSLHVAPRRAAPLGAVVGFSGRLIAPERLAAETRSKPPVLLLHGDRDDIVPPSSMPEAADALQAAGFETYTHVMPGTAHGIAPDGLSLALSFLREKLGRD